MVNGAWPSVSVSLRAHGFKRLADALHGAARERGIADEREAALLRRKQAGDHAHGRAGVAAVERLVGGGHAAGDAGDFDRALADLVDLGAQRLHAGQGGGTVGAGGEVGEARGSLGEGAEHGVAVADGLVAGQAQASVDIAGGADKAFFGGGVQEGLRVLDRPFKSTETTWARNSRGVEPRAIA